MIPRNYSCHEVGTDPLFFLHVIISVINNDVCPFDVIQNEAHHYQDLIILIKYLSWLRMGNILTSLLNIHSVSSVLAINQPHPILFLMCRGPVDFRFLEWRYYVPGEWVGLVSSTQEFMLPCSISNNALKHNCWTQQSHAHVWVHAQLPPR